MDQLPINFKIGEWEPEGSSSLKCRQVRYTGLDIPLEVNGPDTLQLVWEKTLIDEYAPKTRKELAVAYGISTKTLYRWMKALGLPTDRRLLTEKCLRVLYKEHGNPYHK